MACITSPRVEGGEDVRLSEDYFIEAQKDKPPEVQDHAAGPRFQGQPDRRSHRRGGSQGRFRAEGCRAALLGERRRREDRSVLQAKGAKTATGNDHDRAGRFQSAAGRCGEPVRHREGRAHDYRRPTCSSSKRSPSSGTTRNRSRKRRRWRRWRRRRRPAEPDFGAPEGNHHRHLESDQGPAARAAPDAENAAFLSQVQSKLRDQAQVAGRAHEGRAVG